MNASVGVAPEYNIVMPVDLAMSYVGPDHSASYTRAHVHFESAMHRERERLQQEFPSTLNIIAEYP
jgi:hypothetical protein